MKTIVFLLLFCLTKMVSATAELSFSALKPINHVGECLFLTLQENLQASSRFHRVDLWAAVQLPSGDLLFMTPLAFAPFSPNPQFFRESLEATKRVHDIFDFEVVVGLSGTYTFYAVYVDEGKNPLTDGDSVYRSNIALVSTTLSDEPPLIPVIDCVAVLPAPTELSAEAGDASVKVTWATLTDAASYVIYWQASDGSGDNLLVPAISQSYMHTGLVNGVTYSYWMTAKDAAGVEGVTSLKVDAIPMETVKPPPAPIALSAEAGDAVVNFSWQAVPGAVSYMLYWQAAGGAMERFSMSDTVFTHNGLVNGTSYTYWVTAVNAAGLESGPSASFTATPQAVAAPSPVVVPPPVVTPPPTTVPSPGDVFRDTLGDGSLGPEMVMIPAGSFQMGDIQGTGLYDDELPVHWVSVSAFAMGRYEVTFAEYDKFADATGRERPNDKGWGRANRPVIYVSWNDATAYAAWLSEQTGKAYRLPTEAEWEYAARSGTETKYWWGNEIGSNQANCYASQWDGIQTAPVGSFAANLYGLYDTVGNLWEWVADPWHSNYEGAPSDGGVWEGDSSRRVLRGGSWYNNPDYCRAALRNGNSSDFRLQLIGFRVAARL